MRRAARAWISRQMGDHGLTAESKVSRFALSVSLKSVVIANLVMFALHVTLNSGGLLPYPLYQALLVGFTVTTLVTFTIGFVFGYAIGNAIRDLSISRDAFARLSSIDPLSGLLNRRAFFEAVENHKNDAVFILFDIDRFKAVNDTYGHLVGDEAIEGVGRALLKVFSVSGAKIARLGGEEFSVVMRKRPRDQHVRMVESARALVSAMPVGQSSVHVTISAGIAEIRPERNIMQVYNAADRALYAAKASGRDRIVHEDDVPSHASLAGRDGASTRSFPGMPRVAFQDVVRMAGERSLLGAGVAHHPDIAVGVGHGQDAHGPIAGSRPTPVIDSERDVEQALVDGL